MAVRRLGLRRRQRRGGDDAAGDRVNRPNTGHDANPLRDELHLQPPRLRRGQAVVGADYFFDHFFGSLRQRQFEAEESEAIKLDLQAIAAELAARPRTLTHRDYHGMNLMVDAWGALRIIDHQDARMGPATYDLVPLLGAGRLHSSAGAGVEDQRRCFLPA